MSLSPDTPTPSSKSAPHGAAFGRDAHRVYDAAQLDGQYVVRFVGDPSCSIVEVQGHHYYSVLDAMANPEHPFSRMVRYHMGLS